MKQYLKMTAFGFLFTYCLCCYFFIIRGAKDMCQAENKLSIRYLDVERT